MKKILCLVFALAMAMALSACGNRQFLDTTYTFNKAIISLPDGTVVEGKVSSWKDYEGDQLQVVVDGTTYLLHASDVVLISD